MSRHRQPTRWLPILRITAVLAAACGQIVAAQDAEPPGTVLKQAPALEGRPRGADERKLPLVLQAREIRGRPDLETLAEGDAELRRGGLVIRADRLSYDTAEDLARAQGKVQVLRDGNVYRGPELQLRLQRFEGYFLEPTYFFGRTGAGGTAKRLDFLDENRTEASGATYSSCPSDGSGGPAWLLSADKVRMDFDTNTGIAEGAVLRFYGVPILASPILSFPLNDERKSGWLPPTVNLDTKSGLQVAAPYYWNIAPNRDATLTPTVSARRGFGLDTEFRYLEARHEGWLNLNLLPEDGLTGRSRYAFDLSHDSQLPQDVNLQMRLLRVSDNDYWKDFPRRLSLTPRLLASDVEFSRPLGEWTSYARAQGWQVLQDPASRIEAPYERLPQIGARYAQRDGLGFEVGLEAEFNRFADPVDAVTAVRPTGMRLHAVGSVGRPFVEPGWTLTPRLSFNAASYALDQPLADGRDSVSRLIPSLSVDSAWLLERDANWFGRAVRQTLEPRLLYVNTPFKDQSGLPNFDAAAKDFNFESIFSENSFSGIDRVSDSHQLTAGVTSRVLDPDTGAETLRLGLVQRYLFRDQRITPDGNVFSQRFSDVLLLGSTTLVPSMTLDASVQYSPDIGRTVRSIVGARYSPGPFRTVGATYRYARSLSEQVELAWQWPIYGPTANSIEANRLRPAQRCSGSWYSVGRINYSTKDSRVTDSVLGLEYDSGCWIGRIVAERLSTGRSEATTRLALQLELVGLSRLSLGSNPLQVLKDNIPGYRLLREDRGSPALQTPPASPLSP
ncbi:MAG: organic solvent tolerance protein [Methylibium sp. NZG]|nr:MAG: organic solvent tolerance protein [Methylibium sp. NZG]